MLRETSSEFCLFLCMTTYKHNIKFSATTSGSLFLESIPSLFFSRNPHKNLKETKNQPFQDVERSYSFNDENIVCFFKSPAFDSLLLSFHRMIPAVRVYCMWFCWRATAQRWASEWVNEIVCAFVFVCDNIGYEIGMIEREWHTEQHKTTKNICAPIQ